MALRKAEKDTEKKSSDRSGIATARLRVAQVLWLMFVICALFLAVGALLVALGANEGNALVERVLRAANAVDLGVFSRNNGVFDFSGDDAEVKNALVNWGIGAVVYLVVGRILDRIVRP